MTHATASQTKLKIFLVEDNEDTRLMLTQLLQGDGHEVRTANTMQAAIREFPVFGGQVLLSDLGLPDGDGWELLRQLQKSGSTPYAIAMSGYGTLADVAASKEAGFRHHLIKPIELSALEQLLEDACREVERTH